MKRPSFQFYPADWRKDPALSTCSLAARGLWIELMCVAHESDEYGVLCINGKGMSTAQIARTVGEIPKVVASLIDELEQAAVFSRRSDGSIYSRRMVSDEHLRNIRSAAGRLGGNPNLLGSNNELKASNGSDLVKQTNKQRTTPSSSSSSSYKNLSEANASSSEKSSPASSAEFPKFWATWPRSDRKDAKGKCEEKWKRFKLDFIADKILAHVELSKRSAKWIDGFEPSPLKYLSERRWEDGEVFVAEYSAEELFIFEQYNSILGAKDWPEGVFDPYSSERSKAIKAFVVLGTKEGWIGKYFEWLANNLEAKAGYGFDWCIRPDVFLRAREGNFAVLQVAA